MEKQWKDTAIYLLSRYLDTEYETELLANVCQETLDSISADILDRFDYLELSRQDIKESWIDWFDWAAHNGTLIHSALRLHGPKPHSHNEMRVIDLLLELSIEAINKLN